AVDTGQRLLCHRFPRLEQVRGNEVLAEQECARVVAEGLRRERFAMPECPGGADGMDAADEAPDPLERLRIAELGRAPAAARVDRDPECAEGERARRRHDRDLALGELARELVLLVDLRV